MLTDNKHYNTWRRMKQRCNDLNDKDYKHYGGRGIKVCNRWLKFENFFEDMFPTYKEGLPLDRINNDGDYTPENCKWSTPSQNGKNKRNSNKIQSDVDYVCYDNRRDRWLAHLPFKTKEEAEKFVQLYYLNRTDNIRR